MILIIESINTLIIELILGYAACQGAKRVSRASQTIKHRTECQAFRWFLGPKESRRLEAQEAWSKDSRKGLLAGLLGETIFQDCVGTPHAAYKGIRVAAGPTRMSPLNPKGSLGTTRTSTRHPGNKLTSQTIEVKSRCNWLGLGLLGSGF